MAVIWCPSQPTEAAIGCARIRAHNTLGVTASRVRAAAGKPRVGGEGSPAASSKVLLGAISCPEEPRGASSLSSCELRITPKKRCKRPSTPRAKGRRRNRREHHFELATCPKCGKHPVKKRKGQTVRRCPHCGPWPTKEQK